jgi:hypothetical protein
MFVEALRRVETKTLLEKVGIHVSRYGLVVTVLLIGVLEFTAGEAQGIQPLSQGARRALAEDQDQAPHTQGTSSSDCVCEDRVLRAQPLGAAKLWPLSSSEAPPFESSNPIHVEHLGNFCEVRESHSVGGTLRKSVRGRIEIATKASLLRPGSEIRDLRGGKSDLTVFRTIY